MTAQRVSKKLDPLHAAHIELVRDRLSQTTYYKQQPVPLEMTHGPEQRRFWAERGMSLAQRDAAAAALVAAGEARWEVLPAKSYSSRGTILHLTAVREEGK